MKRSICTILVVALLVLPAGVLGVAQEGTPLAPQGWGTPREDLGLAPPEGRDLEGWEPPPLPTGPGAVITVTTTDDELNIDGDCALREAIEAANTNAAVDACVAGNGADTVLVPAGTYTLTIPGADENNNQIGDLDIRDHVTLTGNGADLTILDGNNLDRVLDVWIGLTVEINDLTVTHGQVVDTHGGGIYNEGTLTLNGVSLLENTVVGSLGYGGGGLANSAWLSDSSATLNGCLVDGNEPAMAGGILSASGSGRTSEIVLNDSSVSNNTASPGPAGGVYVGHYAGSQNAVASIVVLNSTVAGNVADETGGGIEVGGSVASNLVTSLTVDHSIIEGNTSNTLAGGGISAINYDGAGPAVTLTVDHSTVRNNIAGASADITGLGGGIYAEGVEATIVDSSIYGNQALGETFAYSGNGGGVFLWEGTATVERTTIRNNTASGTGFPAGFGAGLFLYNGEATVRNSTVSGNQASYGGGGVSVVGDAAYASLTLENSTVAGNDAGAAGGGIRNENLGPGAATVFKNSVVAGNTAPSNESCSNPDLGFGPGTLDSLGNNLEDYDYCEFDQPTDLPDTNPLLGPLQDNGGPTWTHALLMGSPAIDAGDDAAAPPTDQRGVPRPQGLASDIGSYEANIYVNTCDDELNNDGDCALREAIEAANTDTAVDACMAGHDHDYITLPACTYTLAIPGVGEDNNQTGDLDILDDLTIYGSGAETTIVDANAIDRVLDILPGQNVEINDVTVTHGRVINDHGAGIFNGSSMLTLNDTILRENEVVSTGGIVGGGALFNDARSGDATATLNNCLVMENTAYGSGGITSAADTGLTAALRLNHTTVTSNTAEYEGGGIGVSRIAGAVGYTSTVTLDSSTVSSNTVSGTGYLNGNGGGISIHYGTGATLVNSTVSGNKAFGSGLPDFSGLGGGIFVGAEVVHASLTMTNTTIAGNSANAAGGGIAAAHSGPGATLTFKNSLVAGNDAPAEGGASCWNWVGAPAVFTSLGHNLEDYNTCEFDQPSDWPNTDPLVGPLQDNGGETWTHALLEGSLARDHGDDAACPPADQRGVPRPQGPHCDIGSFEAYPDMVPPAVMVVSPPDGASDVALDATVVLTFSEPISVPTFAYAVAPDPGGWTESWGPNDTVVSLTHDVFAYDTAYTATVTAAEDRAGNPMASPYAWSFTTVAEPCNPVETVTVEGPASLLVGETGVYSATYAPVTATLPVTLTWEDGTVDATAAYSWTLPGTYTLAVTATNPCGEASGTYPVVVSSESYWIFLPLVVKDRP